MSADAQAIMALRDRYLEQAAEFYYDARRHDGLAERAIDPDMRHQHQLAAASYREQWRTMQDMAQRQQGILEASHPDAPKRDTPTVERFDPDRDARREAERQAAEAARNRWRQGSWSREDRERDRDR
jgi:hypothetical protein